MISNVTEKNMAFNKEKYNNKVTEETKKVTAKNHKKHI